VELREALREVVGGNRLDRDQARAVFAGALSESADPVALGALLGALAARGEAVAEIVGAAEALRAAMRPFAHDCPQAVDTCGTGGDGLGSFNLSTAAALVAAAAGAKVIKHGNRSVSSMCGSADLLEAAGVPLELDAAQAAVVFEEVGITFLFAPGFHPAMRFAAPVRKAMGVRTIFNFLGPLCNPGGVRRHLLGVSDPDRVEAFAQVLEGLGFESAYVVHGAGGADELTLAGANRVRAVGAAPELGFDAVPLGLEEAPVAALAGGDAARNLRLWHDLLAGAGGPMHDAVCLNAGATLVVAGVADSAADGVERARRALASGAARRLLARWVEIGGRVARGASA